MAVRSVRVRKKSFLTELAEHFVLVYLILTVAMIIGWGWATWVR